MSMPTEEPLAGRLVLLGGMGAGKPDLLWKEIVGDTESGPIILSLAGTVHSASSEQRVRLYQEALSGLGIAARIVRVSTQQPIEESADQLRGSTVVLLVADEPRMLLEAFPPEQGPAPGARLWSMLRDRLKAGLTLVVPASIAAALGAFAFAPLKPFPADVEDLEFELLAGIGMLPGTVILPYFDQLSQQILGSLTTLIPPDLTMLGIDEQAVLLSGPTGWRVAGLGSVTILRHNEAAFTVTAGASIPDGLLTC
jgi:hypothetical protein